MKYPDTALGVQHGLESEGRFNAWAEASSIPSRTDALTAATAALVTAQANETAAAAALAADPTNQTLIDAETATAALLVTAQADVVGAQIELDDAVAGNETGRLEVAAAVAQSIRLILEFPSYQPSHPAEVVKDFFREISIGVCAEQIIPRPT